MLSINHTDHDIFNNETLFCSRSVQILVRATAVPVCAEELAMQKAMDTAVTVCLFIMVATVKVSRNKYKKWTEIEPSMRSREGKFGK